LPTPASTELLGLRVRVQYHWETARRGPAKFLCGRRGSVRLSSLPPASSHHQTTRVDNPLPLPALVPRCSNWTTSTAGPLFYLQLRADARNRDLERSRCRPTKAAPAS